LKHLKGSSTTSQLIMPGTPLQHSSELGVATHPWVAWSCHSFFLTFRSTLFYHSDYIYLAHAARMVCMRSKSVIYHAQIAQEYQRRVSKELRGRLYVHVSVINYE